MAYTINDAYDSKNLVEFFTDPELDTLGNEIFERVREDEESRKEWVDSQRDWLKLAAQVRETKSYPWESASNIKYPLMTIACMQFHARALPGLIPNDRPVKYKVLGEDPDGGKARRGERVSQFMSYQVLEDMEEWLDDLDRLLLILPMIGLAYKKSYYSAEAGRLRSVLLLPEECIVNYHATDYKRARVTHKLMMDPNELVEMQRSGSFRDVELAEPEQKKANQTRDETLGFTRGNTKDDPYELYEVHHWWDLDGDGYKEPYIITVEADSKTVLRIVPRWSSEESVFINEAGEISKIVADNFFTPYRLIPDPNSAVYGIGLGTLLGPTNEAVNTLINQLIDAGTLSNLQCGFIGRGAKLKGGATRFRPAEWKLVNTTGDDLRKSIFPMPVREPSSTLFNLMSFLVNAGERIASVSEMMMGENPGQNTPATTAMATLEQGMKVFNSIYKRVHRSLKAEFKILYKLNYETLDEDFYRNMLDVEIDMSVFGGDVPSPEQMQILEEALRKENRAAIVEDDFNLDGLDIQPASDPTMVSDSLKMMRANSLLEKMERGLIINREVATRQILEAEGHDNINELMFIPPQPPSIEEKEFDLEVRKEMRETINSYFDNLLSVAEAEAAEEGQQLEGYSRFINDISTLIQANKQETKDNGNDSGSTNGAQTS